METVQEKITGLTVQLGGGIMRPLMACVAALVLMGCGGDDDTDTEVTESCDDAVTTPLSGVANDDWPEGLDAAVTAYKALGGLWEGENCLDDSFTVNVKIVTKPIEEIMIVTSGVSSSVACGCLNDPEYGHDNTYSPVGIVPELELSVEMDVEDDEGIDPGVDNRSFTMEGGMFGAGQPLLFRACASDTIDPIFDSEYDQVAAIFRLEPNNSGTLDAEHGTPTMTFFLDTLEEGGATTQCDITGLEQITSQENL